MQGTNRTNLIKKMFCSRYTRTYIWDVADLETPTLMNTYISGQKSIDHNQYILGDLTYQSNYYVSPGVLTLWLRIQIVFFSSIQFLLHCNMPTHQN